jgi:parallel beta-helix repeat protein
MVILAVASTASLIMNQGGRLGTEAGPQVGVNGQIAHSSITITGDSGFTPANGVTGGSGTASDPYIISGWSITSTAEDSLTISNTRSFFVVRNVTLNGGFQGIVFTNVTNGRLENSQSYQYETTAIRVISSTNVALVGDEGSAGGCGPNEGCGGSGIWVDSSSNILVSGNSLPGTQGDNIAITRSKNVTVIGNSIAGATYHGMRVSGSSNITISKNSFSRSGLAIDGLGPGASYKITSDNLVNGKPLYYYHDCSGGLTIDRVAVGQLIISNCSDVQLSNLSVTGTDVGITMVHVQRALIENVNASSDKFGGLLVSGSFGITIENGDFSLTPFSFGFLYPLQWGILIQQSNSTTVSGSRFYSDSISLEMDGSLTATVDGNSFSSDYTNVCLSSSTDIHIYHNNFSPQQGYYCTSDTEPGHFWDNGYPSGGNYWSNYAGVDKCSGPLQSMCTGGDGIGDTPYNVTGGVYKDNYPLMRPFVASPIVSVVIGTDGNIYSSVSRPDGSWNSWRSLSGSTPSTPVLCRSGPDRVDLIVRGVNNGVYHKSFVNGVWSSWESLEGLTLDTPACAVLSGSLFVAVRGLDNSTYYNLMNLQSGSWTGWISLGGATPSSPAPVATPSRNRLDLLVRGMDNAVYHKSLVNGLWSPTWKSLGGIVFASPVATSDGSTLHLVVSGAANSLWYNSLSFSSDAWSGWFNLSGSTSSAPSLVATPGLNRVDIVVRGLNNGIYHKSLINGVWSTTWDTVNGLTLNAPAATGDGSNLRILVVATDGSLVSNLLPLTSATWVGWTSLNGSTKLSPALA